MKRLLTNLEPYVEDGARIMLFVFLIPAIVIFISYTLMAVFHHYPLDYGEAPLLDQAMRLVAGQNIYRLDLTSPPYTISNYPPLYVLALSPFVKLFGPSFLAGRAISLLCSVASAIFLALIIYTFTKDRLASILTAMIFFTIPYVVYWTPLLRVDMLALAFSTAGLYVVAQRPTTRGGIIMSALLLTAAIYSRQSFALAAPLAASVWLWSHNRIQARRLLTIVGGLSIILFIMINIITRGGFFFNIVTANVNEFDFERLESWFRKIKDTAPILLVFGTAFLVLTFRGVRSALPSHWRGWQLLTPYLVGAGLSALTIGKIGSNANYLLEFFAAISLSVGAVIAWSRDHRWLRTALLVLLALQTGHLMQTTLKEYVGDLKPRLQTAGDLNKLERIVKAADGPMLGDEYMGMITLQDRPLFIQPFEVTQLVNAGLWDQAALIRSIRAQEFPVILIHHFVDWPVYKERWTPEMLSAIMQSYTPTDFLADTIVYQPFDHGGNGTQPSGLVQSGDRLQPYCPDAPWQLPTSSALGMMRLDNFELGFMGEGYENSIPVYAVDDGLLLRRPDWNDAVAIQHDDPVRQGEKVWSFYGGMASGWGELSFVNSEFPPDSVDVPVKAGQLLGYQGMWSGEQDTPIWVHLHFAVVQALEDGSFPAVTEGLNSEGEYEPNESEREYVIDPIQYLGIGGFHFSKIPTWSPLRCQETSS